MKTNHVKNSASLLFISLISLVLFNSCSKENFSNNNSGDPVYSTNGTASGAQQNPAVATGGSATLTGVFNARTNNWDYTINWTSLSSMATAVQIHGPASVGVNG